MQRGLRTRPDGDPQGKRRATSPRVQPGGQFPLHSLCESAELKNQVASDVPLAEHSDGVARHPQGLAQCARCIICLKTGEWPRHLEDVEEMETVMQHQHEDEVQAKATLGLGGKEERP